MDTDQFIEQAEAFLIEIEREFYLVGSGRKEQLEIASIFDRYPGLFSHQTVEARLTKRAQAAEPVAARYLATFAADGYMENTVKAISEEITNRELAATVQWDGEELPYRQVRTVLAQETDQARRHDLHHRQLAVTAQQHDRRAERFTAACTRRPPPWASKVTPPSTRR